MSTFYIKYGATAPDLETILTSDGVAIDLTGHTVELRYKGQFGSLITKSATLLTQSGATLGGVRVENVASDGATHHPVGRYYAEWYVTYADGKVGVHPTEVEATYDYIEIQPSLA